MSKRPHAEDVLEKNLVRRMIRREVLHDVGDASLRFHPRAVKQRIANGLHQRIEATQAAAKRWAGNHKWSLAALGGAVIAFVVRKPIGTFIETHVFDSDRDADTTIDNDKQG